MSNSSSQEEKFERCIFCKNMEKEDENSFCSHTCPDCGLYIVFPAGASISEKRMCKCDPGRQPMFVTRCGIIYDGHAQCGCEICCYIEDDISI